jgi:2,4-diaminopentanoate dehydrogenase
VTSSSYRVIQWATGHVGALCLAEIIKNPDLELAGVLVYGDKAGKDAGTIVGVDAVGVTATRDREVILATEADCVIYTPLAASMDELDNDIVALLESGKNVITTAGYFAPKCRGADVVARLEAACRAGNTSLLGTGIEPGFMLDRIGPMLTGVCVDIDYLRFQEIADCAHHPAAMLMKEAIGFGKQPEEVKNDPVFGPYWKSLFTESITSIAVGLGLELDEVQTSLEVATASEGVDVAIGHIPAGAVVGVWHTVNGIVAGEAFIRTDHIWCVVNGVNGWPAPVDRYRYTFQIEGRPSVRAVVDPLPSLTPGGNDYDAALLGTAATAINAIPEVLAAAPGIMHPTVFAPWRRRGSKVAMHA